MRKRWVWQSVFLLGILLLALTCCGGLGDSGTGSLPGGEPQVDERTSANVESRSDEGASADREPRSDGETSDSGETHSSEEIQGGSGTSDSGKTGGGREGLSGGNREPEATLEIACIVEDLGLVSSGRKLLRDAAEKLTHDPEGQYAYVYTEPEAGEEDAFYTRTLADLTAGKGPDILYISPDRLQSLQEKGVLAELSRYLPTETRDGLLPAALSMGTMEGGLYGIPTDFTLVWSLITTRENVSGDTWTVEQLLDRMEACQDSENVLLYLENGASSGVLLGNVLLMDLENTPFIDWEKRECYFDGELFQRAMRLCKACGRDNVSLGEDSYELIRQGDCLGTVTAGFSIQDFSERANRLGEDVYHCVGLPTQGSSGSFAQTNGIVVVNSQCTQDQALTAFLEYLYSREGQAPLRNLYAMSVLRFPADDITTLYGGAKTVENYSYVGILEEKADGNTYAEEYSEFLDNCVARPMKYLDVWNMIMEDAEKYLEGDQSLEEACRIIQSRVQLYLQE